MTSVLLPPSLKVDDMQGCTRVWLVGVRGEASCQDCGGREFDDIRGHGTENPKTLKPQLGFVIRIERQRQ